MSHQQLSLEPAPTPHREQDTCGTCQHFGHTGNVCSSASSSRCGQEVRVTEWCRWYAKAIYGDAE